MAPKRTARKPAPAPVDIEESAFVPWLRTVIGDTKHEAFAAEIQVSRQALSGVLTGRRPPSARLLKSLQRYGMLRARTVYTIRPVEP